MIYNAGIALMNFMVKWDLDVKEAVLPVDLHDRGKKARAKRAKRTNN
ncbi:MAG: hypothetical protein GKR99_16810 [Rhodobacteraceae bacterium]|nr:hypothetical protein [Paracoccaceae bacterium]